MAKKKKTVTKKKSKSRGLGKRLLWLIPLALIIGVASLLLKDTRSSYDERANGLCGAALKTAVHDMIRDHKYLDFDQSTSARYWWDNYFKQTDWSDEGYFIDMYSNEKHKTYVGGKTQNREHCMPRSWWGKKDKYSAYDANGDLHNLFPADYTANAAKSNLPLGEVGIAKFDNGVSKVGMNTYPKGYRGQVFEPSDEYKGDFARVYFYMITCYEDYAYDWKKDATKSMLTTETYPGLQPWALSMLIKWHKEDPVSNKEIARNNVVDKIQGNRNPFVDYPELVDHIWGESKNVPFSMTDSGVNKNSQSGTKNYINVYIEEAANIVNTIIRKIKK